MVEIFKIKKGLINPLPVYGKQLEFIFVLMFSYKFCAPSLQARHHVYGSFWQFIVTEPKVC